MNIYKFYFSIIACYSLTTSIGHCENGSSLDVIPVPGCDNFIFKRIGTEKHEIIFRSNNGQMKLEVPFSSNEVISAHCHEDTLAIVTQVEDPETNHVFIFKQSELFDIVTPPGEGYFIALVRWDKDGEALLVWLKQHPQEPPIIDLGFNFHYFWKESSTHNIWETSRPEKTFDPSSHLNEQSSFLKTLHRSAREKDPLKFFLSQKAYINTIHSLEEIISLLESDYPIELEQPISIPRKNVVHSLIKLAWQKKLELVKEKIGNSQGRESLYALDLEYKNALSKSEYFRTSGLPADYIYYQNQEAQLFFNAFVFRVSALMNSPQRDQTELKALVQYLYNRTMEDRSNAASIATPSYAGLYHRGTILLGNAPKIPHPNTIQWDFFMRN